MKALPLLLETARPMMSTMTERASSQRYLAFFLANIRYG